MNFLFIRDITTGKELQVDQPEGWRGSWVVTETGSEPIEVKKRSLGKVIRTWMKERKKDVG